jgi:hypothetical protein
MRSIRASDDAMALAQPNVWNFASAMRPALSSFAISRRASPQVMLPTVASRSGFGISPTFLG